MLARVCTEQVIPGECNWTLQDADKGRILTVTLQKAHQMTWLMLIRS